MAEWLYEDGVGEARAALVDGGEILEALIEREDGGARPGSVSAGRLARVIQPGRRGLALLATGQEVLIEPIPARVSEGQSVLVELTREALPEPGLGGLRPKRALGRIAAADAAEGPAPSLRERIERTGLAVRDLRAHHADALEAHGWSALMDEATRGEVTREAASLRLYPTPAMLLIDVDGSDPPPVLAIAGARLAALTIRRMGLAGSIGIDLPTVEGKAERLAAAAAIDAVLPPPFERTAVNGYGFIQIVRKRARASLLERLRADPVETAALASLRLAERHGGGAGPVVLRLASAVAERIMATPAWIAALERRRGGALALRPDPTLAIGAAHAG